MTGSPKPNHTAIIRDRHKGTKKPLEIRSLQEKKRKKTKRRDPSKKQQQRNDRGKPLKSGLVGGESMVMLACVGASKKNYTKGGRGPLRDPIKTHRGCVKGGAEPQGLDSKISAKNQWGRTTRTGKKIPPQGKNGKHPTTSKRKTMGETSSKR